MATPVFTAVNQTFADIVLVQLALTVPASGQVTLSNFNSTSEIMDDKQLRDLINSDDILIFDGVNTLTKEQSLQYLTPVVTPTPVNPMTTHGDIVFGDASPVGAPKRLQGVNGAYLRSGGTGADPTFVRVLDVDAIIADVSVGASMDASAIMQLNSTSKGLLLPRMTTTQMLAISAPATGLLVYDTDTRKSHFYDGTAWRSVTASTSYVITVATDGSADFTSIQDAIDFADSPTTMNRYVVSVSAGVYTENVSLRDYVSVNGTGYDCVIEGTVTADNPTEMTVTYIQVSATNAPAVVMTNVTYPGELDLLGCFIYSTYDDTVAAGVVRCVCDIEGGTFYTYRECEVGLTVNDTVHTADSTNQCLYHTHGTEQCWTENFNTYAKIDTDNPGNEINGLYNTNTHASNVYREIGYTMYANLNGTDHANIVHIIDNDGGNGDFAASKRDLQVICASDNGVKVVTVCSENATVLAVVRFRFGAVIKQNVLDTNIFIGSSTTANDVMSVFRSLYRMDADVHPGRYTADGILGKYRYEVVNNFGSSNSAPGLFNGAEINADVTDWTNVEAALGGQAGANANYVFKSDGSGGGAMVPNTLNIAKLLTVGSAGGVDYTTINAAVTAAISGGASASAPWEVRIFPGSYTEPPMTIPPGIILVTDVDSRVDNVFVTASNAAQDLFTVTGGTIVGITATGVTDPAKCLFRCATAGTISRLFRIGLHGCSNGIVVSGGAKCFILEFSIALTAAGQGVGTAITTTGSGSYTGIQSVAALVPAALLPLYATNPIQTIFRVADSATFSISVGTIQVSPKDSTADVLLCDGGSYSTVLTLECFNSGNILHIGSGGTNTIITTSGLGLVNNTKNVKIESTTGTVFGNFTTDALNDDIVAGAEELGIVQDRTTRTIRLVGDVRYSFTTSDYDVNFSDFFSDFTSTGVCGDGLVTAGSGLHVAVAAGDGWSNRAPSYDDVKWVEWVAVPSLLLTASNTNYVYYDQATSAIVASTSPPGSSSILLATVVTDGSGIRFLHNTRTVVDNLAGRLDTYLLNTAKVRSKSGMATVQGTTARKINVGSGSYYVALNNLSYAGSGGDATFSYFYGTNGATEVAPGTSLDITNYDLTGTLTAMTGSYFRADTVVITSDGRISVIYGTAQYSLQSQAEAAAAANIPTFLQPTAFTSAKVIVQEAVGIVEVMDIRPTSSSGGTGGTGVTAHSALSGLGAPADDHTQYLLASGSRSMAGALNMGAYAISNVGTVDGVTVSAHASRHNPGGADAITVGTPTAVLVGATAIPGSASSLVRSDHQHGVAAGVAPSSVGAANAEGASSSVARADHVHDHGSHSAGTDHAVVIAAGANGFMSGADKTKLNGIATGATNTPLTSTAPTNVSKSAAVVGAATDAAHADHKHDASTAAPTTLAVGNANAEGTGTELARALHQHAVTRGTPVDVGTANNAGAGTDFAAGNHVHAGLTRGANDFSAFTLKGAPVNADLLLIEDSAALGVKKYVTLGTLPTALPYAAIVSGTTTVTTTSASDVVMGPVVPDATTMTITPAAGKYLVTFGGDVSWGSSGATITMDIWAAGALVQSSERPLISSNTTNHMNFTCQAIVTVNGAQAIEGRWRRSAGTVTNTRRTLSILRVL